MTTSQEDLPYAWAASAAEALLSAERAESELSYVSECGTEKARKLLGSYYTPADVARFFWAEFFTHAGIENPKSALDYIYSHHLVEPSVGAGALFFALLEKLCELGLPPEMLSQISVDLIDLNEQALDFVRSQVTTLEDQWGVEFSSIQYLHGDFQETTAPRTTKPLVFFGNPPFVSNPRGTSKWKNLYADFVEIALERAGEQGSVQFILPLSIAFSRDYRDLRQSLRDAKQKVVLSNFDNIPDTLFKSGKPLHSNTNKANSQRCSIVGVFPSEEFDLRSTQLHRWSKADRHQVLGKAPKYLEVTDYAFDDQFPRPTDERILYYLDQSKNEKCLADLISETQKHTLYVGGVARNYIGIREEAGSGVHDLWFENREQFYVALNILASDLFFDYWLSVGDGFHLTKANLLCFPIHPKLEATLRSKKSKTQRIWSNRKKYAKTKLNSGREMRSFDFTHAFDSLYLSRIR